MYHNVSTSFWIGNVAPLRYVHWTCLESLDIVWCCHIAFIFGASFSFILFHLASATTFAKLALHCCQVSVPLLAQPMVSIASITVCDWVSCVMVHDVRLANELGLVGQKYWHTWEDTSILARPRMLNLLPHQHLKNPFCQHPFLNATFCWCP